MGSGSTITQVGVIYTSRLVLPPRPPPPRTSLREALTRIMRRRPGEPFISGRKSRTCLFNTIHDLHWSKEGKGVSTVPWQRTGGTDFSAIIAGTGIARFIT